MKKAALKNFAICTEKKQTETLLKTDSNIDVFFGILQNF